jgi:NADH-quinone oxidoreductase subunit L
VGDAGHAVNAVFETTTGAIGMAYLIPLLPLVGFAAVLLLAKPLRERAAFIATGASTLTFLLSVMVFLQVQADPGTHVRPMVDWISVGPLQVTWSLLVDQLTAVMLLVVTGVGTLVHVYSHGYMHGDPRYERFFAYLNLFLFSMLVLVLGSSFLVLFVGWELVGLSSYLLIGFWFEKREYAAAAKKAFITNRVGDVSFMVAMFILFAAFGTLDFLPILDHAGELSPNLALAVVLLLMGGAAAKSAQIPLYVWLPDAMAGPTPVSALIHAATMVTAGVYLTVRSSPLLVQSLDGMVAIAWIGAATALLAALIAIRQDDIKKILAYSTVSQLGYMFVGVGTGGFSEGIFHLTTHAFFKGLLFLAAGSVMHAMANEGNVWKMGGLRKVMPITFWTSAVAWLAISGVPPFAGFFSKDQILTTAYENGFTGIWVVGVLVAVLTAFYMTRWFLLIFMGDKRFSSDVHPHESPTSMTFPLLVLGALSLVGGAVLNLTHHGPFYRWLQPAVASTEGLAFAEHGALTEPALIAISVVAALVGIGASWAVYGRRDLSAGAIAEPIRGPIAELMQRKFFVDELYEAVFVRFGGWLANGMVWFDTNVIDGLVNGAGAVSTATARRVRRVQTGLVRGYLAGMVAGAVILLAVLLVQVR